MVINTVPLLVNKVRKESILEVTQQRAYFNVDLQAPRESRLLAHWLYTFPQQTQATNLKASGYSQA